MTSVLFLGAGEFSAELGAAFRRLGVTVHTADTAAARDAAQIRSLVEWYSPDHILPLVEDVDVEILTEIEESGVAGVVPSARGCSLTVARDALRRTANEELGLPTTAYRFVDTREDFDAAVAELGMPCIVKPATFSSGRGHTVVRSPADADAAWDNARADTSAVMVERFVDFDHEITVLTVRSIDPNTGKLATWFCEPIGHVHRDGRLIDSWQPMALNTAALDNARSMAARISNALGGRGICAVEMFVAGDDVYFSGVTPRPHVSGAVTLVTQRFSQYDLHARAVLGLPIDATLVSPGAHAPFHADLDLARALAVPESDVRFYDEFPGVALATAETVDEARARVREVAGAVRL